MDLFDFMHHTDAGRLEVIGFSTYPSFVMVTVADLDCSGDKELMGMYDKFRERLIEASPPELQAHLDNKTAFLVRLKRREARCVGGAALWFGFKDGRLKAGLDVDQEDGREIRLSENAGHFHCKVSTGICESVTFGSGKLDDLGYWEFPCLACAERYKAKNPDMAVWPVRE